MQSQDSNKEAEAKKVMNKYYDLLTMIHGVSGMVAEDNFLKIYVRDKTIKEALETAIKDIEGVPIKCQITGSIGLLSKNPS